MSTRDAKFGEAPLAQTVAAAGSLRRLSSGCCCPSTQSFPSVAAMLAQVRRMGERGAGRGGSERGEQRAADR